MLLKNELEHVTHLCKEKVDEQRLFDYASKIYKEKNYKDFRTRISNDLKFAVAPPHYICDLYDKYGCNDMHVTTLFAQVIKNEYPRVYALILAA